MFDHIGFAVKSVPASRAFYEAALAPLGAGVAMAFEDRAVGLGKDGKPSFWITSGAEPPTRVHLAFAADSRAAVDAFYKAAMAHGGRDNGGPGLRPDYHENYYAAFVYDPDGNNVEAVCHRAE